MARSPLPRRMEPCETLLPHSNSPFVSPCLLPACCSLGLASADRRNNDHMVRGKKRGFVGPGPTTREMTGEFVGSSKDRKSGSHGTLLLFFLFRASQLTWTRVMIDCVVPGVIHSANLPIAKKRSISHAGRAVLIDRNGAFSESPIRGHQPGSLLSRKNPRTHSGGSRHRFVRSGRYLVITNSHPISITSDHRSIGRPRGRSRS